MLEDKDMLKRLQKKYKRETDTCIGKNLTVSALKAMLKKHNAPYDEAAHRKHLTAIRTQINKSGSGYVLADFSYAGVRPLTSACSCAAFCLGQAALLLLG
jgi:hypothetical protein